MAVNEPHNDGRPATASNIPVLMESAASEHYFDDYITSGLRGRLPNYKTLMVSRTITTSGNHD